MSEQIQKPDLNTVRAEAYNQRDKGHALLLVGGAALAGAGFLIGFGASADRAPSADAVGIYAALTVAAAGGGAIAAGVGMQSLSRAEALSRYAQEQSALSSANVTIPPEVIEQSQIGAAEVPTLPHIPHEQ